jgi:G3E family GTPase
MSTEARTMDLLIVSGFLGSGKSTTIMDVVGRIHERTGKRVAIIVNDFGKIGVDGKVMERKGLKVMEFWGGCICCTLGSLLNDAIKKVVEEMFPDYVIIEPSGIADPKQIHSTLKRYSGPPFDRTRTIAIVDASRYDIFSQTLAIPLKNQIGTAETIFINKMDEVEQGEVDRIADQIKHSGFEKDVIGISALEGINMDMVYQALTD